MTDIVQQIVKKADEYRLVTGIKPKSVFLGTSEIQLLRKWCYNNCYYYDTKTEDKARFEIYGLSIHEANTNDPHIKFSN
jgi:hypothetical protein